MKKKILIIEDEPKLLKAISNKLVREGFTVLEARDGEEGIKIAFEKNQT